MDGGHCQHLSMAAASSILLLEPFARGHAASI